MRGIFNKRPSRALNLKRNIMLTDATIRIDLPSAHYIGSMGAYTLRKVIRLISSNSCLLFCLLIIMLIILIIYFTREEGKV